MKTAVNIHTEHWNRIIEGLITENWKLIYKYDQFDAGIDFDFLVLKKGNSTLSFGWDNWEEGEIQGSTVQLEWLSRKFDIPFQYGKPVNLDPKIIALTKFQIIYNRIKNKLL